MEHLLTDAALMVEALVLVWLAKLLWGVVLRLDMDRELTTNDNPAAAITLAGYFLGVFIALAGAVPGTAVGLVQALLEFGAFGLTGVVVLFLSLFGAPLVGGVKLQRDIIAGRNVASALVLAGTFIATGAIFAGAVAGEGASANAWLELAVFQVLGQLVLALTAHLFELITPYDLHIEVRERQNLAAALGYAGALVAMGLLLRNAVLGDFVSWDRDLMSFGLYCVPLILLWPVRSLVVNGVLLSFRDLNAEIATDRNVGAAALEAATYVGFALLVTSIT